MVTFKNLYLIRRPDPTSLNKDDSFLYFLTKVSFSLENIYDYFFIVIILSFDTAELKSLLIFPEGSIYVRNVKLSMKLSVKLVRRPLDVPHTTVQLLVAPSSNSTRLFFSRHKQCFLWLQKVFLPALGAIQIMYDTLKSVGGGQYWTWSLLPFLSVCWISTVMFDRGG